MFVVYKRLPNSALNERRKEGQRKWEMSMSNMETSTGNHDFCARYFVYVSSERFVFSVRKYVAIADERMYVHQRPY